MRQYLDLLKDIKETGKDHEDRTGVGTRAVFGCQMRFDLSKGFPLMTTKKVFWKGVVYELLWFLKGDTNVKYLQEHGVHIWDQWCDKDGNLGPVYGASWRRFGETYYQHGVDQISEVLQSLRYDPDSRRHIVCAWNPIALPDMALPPCHCLFQFNVEDGKLSCQLYQRSCDVFLGLPFNIASYSLLTHMIAHELGLGVGEFIWTGGNVHIYKNHFNQIEEQLTRTPRELPQLVIKNPKESIFDYDFEDFELVGYNPYPAIKAPIAV
nr:MAG TPA: Thymidylate synthase [Caudoviricetes sp.]